MKKYVLADGTKEERHLEYSDDLMDIYIWSVPWRDRWHQKAKFPSFILTLLFHKWNLMVMGQKTNKTKSF